MAGPERVAARLLAPPDGAAIPTRGERAPGPGSVLPAHSSQCFGCGDDLRDGLRLDLRAGPGLTVTASMRVGEAHQGAPGLAHGGIVAAAFDEVLGSLHWILGIPWVTGQLLVDYLRPVPVGTHLSLTAQADAMIGRRVFCSGAAVGSVTGDGTGEQDVLATAAGVFVTVEVEHFRRHAPTRKGHDGRQR